MIYSIYIVSQWDYYLYIITVMNRILAYILSISILLGFSFIPVNAVLCVPTFNSSYTVEWDCEWPWNYKVYWDIIVWSRIVTVPSWFTLGIDLWSNKATFTTGRVRFQGSGKMDNSTSGRYYISVPYGIWTTACPSWFQVLNQISPSTPTNYQSATSTAVASTGTMYCWK